MAETVSAEGLADRKRFFDRFAGSEGTGANA